MAEGDVATATVGTSVTGTYTVQNPHMTPSAARAIIQGKEMVATVDALELELVSELPQNGTIKLRFIGDEIAGAQALFVNDAKIKATFTAADAAAAGGQ